jgi:hypothetical protein
MLVVRGEEEGRADKENKGGSEGVAGGVASLKERLERTQGPPARISAALQSLENSRLPPEARERGTVRPGLSRAAQLVARATGGRTGGGAAPEGGEEGRKVSL